MAKKVIVELIDDIDGTPIADGKGETIQFAIDGLDYTIDLGPKNARAFRKSLDRYVEHATRTPVGRRTSRAAASTTPLKRDPAQLHAIREWATSNGYKVSGRGRIPVAVEQAYRAAN